MASKKDTFKRGNPALSFITQEDLQEATIDVDENRGIKIKSVRKLEAPEGYKVNPEYIETKSKRVQLLLQPSTVEAIKSLAKKKSLSMNEAINEAIHEYIHNECTD